MEEEKKKCVNCSLLYDPNDWFCSKCGNKLFYNTLEIPVRLNLLSEVYFFDADVKCIYFHFEEERVNNPSRFILEKIKDISKFIEEYFKENREDTFEEFYRREFCEKCISRGRKYPSFEEYKRVIEENGIIIDKRTKNNISIKFRKVLENLIRDVGPNYLKRIKLPLTCKNSLKNDFEDMELINILLKELEGKSLYYHPVYSTLHNQKEMEEILKIELKHYNLGELYVHHATFIGIEFYKPSNKLIALEDLFISKRLKIQKLGKKFRSEDILELLGIEK